MCTHALQLYLWHPSILAYSSHFPRPQPFQRWILSWRKSQSWVSAPLAWAMMTLAARQKALPSYCCWLFGIVTVVTMVVKDSPCNAIDWYYWVIAVWDIEHMLFFFVNYTHIRCRCNAIKNDSLFCIASISRNLGFGAERKHWNKWWGNKWIYTNM